MYFIPFPILQKEIVGEGTGFPKFYVIGLLNKKNDIVTQLQFEFLWFFFFLVSHSPFEICSVGETFPCLLMPVTFIPLR